MSHDIYNGNYVEREGQDEVIFLRGVMGSATSFLSTSTPTPFFLSLAPTPRAFPFSFLSRPTSFLRGVSSG